MSDLLQRLKLGTKAMKLISWPGNEQKVLLKILSQQERQEATFATELLFKNAKIELNMVTANEYEAEQATQMLYKSIRDPEKPEEAICSNISEFRKALSVDEKRILLDEYIAFEKEVSPSPDNLSDEEFDRVLSDLKKTPETVVGSISSISTLKRLLLSLAKAPLTLPKVSGSTSSPSSKR